MILALDVGFSNMGWSVIENGRPVDVGVIETEKSKKKSTRTADDYAHRSSFIAAGLTDILMEYRPGGVIAELPSGGAQNARAMAMMNMATAIVATFCQLTKLPAEWVTPGDSKKAFVGFRDAPKKMMIQKAVEMFGGNIVKKPVRCKKSKKYPDGVRESWRIEMCGKEMPEGTFEHIADALAAYNAQRTGNLVKLFG